MFGREVDSCQTDLDIPVAPLNPAAVGQRIAALVAKNGAKTPIGASLEKVADDLKSVTGEKLIVLVTDGEETCGGDPAAAIDNLRKAGIGTRVSIVGFALDDEKLADDIPPLVGCGRRRVLRRQGRGRPRQVADRGDAPGFRGGERAGPGAGERHRRRRRPCRFPPAITPCASRAARTATKPVVVKPKETANVASVNLRGAVRYQPNVLRSAVIGSSHGSCSPFSALDRGLRDGHAELAVSLELLFIEELVGRSLVREFGVAPPVRHRIGVHAGDR